MNKDVNKPPTFIRVYNPDTILWIQHQECDTEDQSLVALGFMEKIKTFRYNKKDLAWGIESNAMCVIF